MNRAPLIIDTDPAIGYAGRDVDDGLAILAMLSDPAVEVVGLTVTFGNTSLSRAVYKAKETLQRAGRSDIPVLAGAASASELGKKTEASEFLIDASLRYTNELQLLAIGPLTNLASAASSEGFFSRMRAVMLLGGTLTAPARFTQQQGFEFNLRQDLAAAHKVFAQAERATILPMEPCRSTSLRWSRLYKMLRAERETTRWAAQQSILWEMLTPFVWGSCGFHPWDVLAACALTNPECFSLSNHKLTLGDGGQLIVGAGRSFNVIKEIKQAAFWRYFDARFGI